MRNLLLNLLSVFDGRLFFDDLDSAIVEAVQTMKKRVSIHGHLLQGSVFLRCSKVVVL